MRLALLTLTLGLVGCCPNPIVPEPQVIIRTERVVTPIPAELLVIPEHVAKLPPAAVRNDDKAVAKWMLDSETRSAELESKLRRIRELYKEQVEAAAQPASTASK